MNKKILIFGAVFCLVASACGSGQATVPTVSPVDIKNTAEAAAFTIVAQTLAAIPTATLPPPTEIPTQTPLVTDTPLSLPTTSIALPSATSVANASGDPCSTRVLSWSPLGRNTTIRIANTTKAAVTVSLYLNETADHNECGYRSYSLGPRNSVVISDLVQGCYDLWAFNNDSKNPVNAASGTSCINDPDKWTFEIHPDFIKFTGP